MNSRNEMLTRLSPSRSLSTGTSIGISTCTSSLFSDNRGKRWSTEEDTYLIQQVQYMSHYDIGRHLKRSENAVFSRIKKLAFHMIQGGEDPEFVRNNLKLNEEDIEQIHSECFIFNQKTNPGNSKFITNMKIKNKKGYFTQPTPQSPEMVVLLEIKSMLRRLLLQNDVKSPKKDMLRISEINLEDLEKRSEEFAKQN